MYQKTWLSEGLTKIKNAVENCSQTTHFATAWVRWRQQWHLQSKSRLQLFEPKLRTVRTATHRCQNSPQLNVWCYNGPWPSTAAPPPETGVYLRNVMNLDARAIFTAPTLQWNCWVSATKRHSAKTEMRGQQVPAELYPPTEERRIFTGCCRFWVVTTFLIFCNSSLFPSFLFSSSLSLTLNKSELLFRSPRFDLVS